MALEAFTDALRRRQGVSPPANAREKGIPGSPDSSEDASPGAGQIPHRAQNTFMGRKPEAHQVFRAIEDQDLSLLAEIAEHDFPLILRPLSTGTNRTPLNHAIECGPSHRGVALLLLGMFSRYVNHLSDADFDKPEARETLRLLRVNFALAMTRGVMQADDSLAASFLQVYVMSKGQAWLSGTIVEISIALRSTTPGEPVALAGQAVRKYAGRTVKQDEIIASLEDYIGNATADLLMMAAWYSVSQLVPEGLSQIPTHYFARDERVFNSFADNLDLHRDLIQQFVGKRLKSQLSVLRTCLDGRTATYRASLADIFSVRSALITDWRVVDQGNQCGSRVESAV
ncbi:hypothetical protein DFH07DRAFT_831359 [Mycena maculata]|uniref:Uncharacterized protein n=1 Tax=Mycena maculata TaxID=230809 RepID=A0AAD7IQ38_9AGAR|nr:hypothetical protein DFH07DRAFT_831359 [Mycena maculata]